MENKLTIIYKNIQSVFLLNLITYYSYIFDFRQNSFFFLPGYVDYKSNTKVNITLAVLEKLQFLCSMQVEFLRW